MTSCTHKVTVSIDIFSYVPEPGNEVIHTALYIVVVDTKHACQQYHSLHNYDCTITTTVMNGLESILVG